MRTAPSLPVLVGVLVAGVTTAAAQNTGGVFPPMVNAGASAAEYRVTLRPQEGDDGLAQRIHVQTAFNDDLMGRIVVASGGSTNDQSFGFVQAELFWDLSEDTDRWRTGLRFDAQIRDGGGPEQFNASWTNQVALTERWTARGILLTKVQVGDRAADGVAFETRNNLFYRTESGALLGVETYNLHGSTEDLDLFGGRQQVGPFAVWPVAEGWNLFTGVLWGANDDSPDTDYRLWLTRNF